jgi:hypothetical protein
LLDRMRQAGEGAASVAEGVRIAREIAEQLREFAQGIQVSTSGDTIDPALRVLDGLR